MPSQRPDARLWPPWLRINRVLRVMLHTRWSAEAWPQVKAEFTKALQIGDRLTDPTGEWQVVGRPYTTNAGKDVHARVQKVGQPDVTELRTWGAHERISVKRAPTEEGKR